jgi:phosphotransferase system  glucose/maltose/N-acetylglucosamine-specific IIC component
VAWSRLGPAKVRTYLLSPIFDSIFGADGKSGLRLVLECALFVALGVLIGIGVAQPSNAVQALTAGLGWTALLAKAGQ